MEKKPEHCQGCALQAARRVEPSGSSARIVLVGQLPDVSSPQGGRPFQDRHGIILNTALKRVEKMYTRKWPEDGVQRWQRLTTYKTYAVQCITGDRPPKETSSRCRVYLDNDIVRLRPQAVVAFGADAMRALLPGTKAKFNDLRGSFVDSTVRNPATPFKLFITFSPKAILAKQGLFDELVRDLFQVFLYAEGEVEHVRYTPEELRGFYRFPRTVDEVRNVCQDILDYSNEGQPPEQHMISVDTETSSLEPHDPTAKIICISFGWASQQATTIMLDHPQGWWTPDELEQVKYHVCRVLASEKPKVLHNAKFDRQMIVHRYGWPLRNTVWDTMLAEHLIEEDKRGVYGLKILTRSRLPAYAGYDSKVDDLREEHGGGTRAQEGKRFRKAELSYVQALKTHAELMVEYQKAFPLYEEGLENWNKSRLKEKERAAAARKTGNTDAALRRIRPEVVGKKPAKVKKPPVPLPPEHREPFDYTMIPLDDLELYAAVDADVTRQHVLHQNLRLNTEYKLDGVQRAKTVSKPLPPAPVKRLMASHVLPTTKTFAAMEFTGFPVDLEYLEDLDSKLATVVEDTERELFQLAGAPFTINNPREITRMLFQTGFYDVDAGKHVVVPLADDIARTSKGQIKADEKALLYVANTFGYEFPKKIISYRKASKARSPFLTNIREHALLDGRIHPAFHINGTATGRTSSSQENMQNIPKFLAGYNIKKIFVPLPGCTLIDTDAKGAEIRIFAAYSGDKQLIDAINGGLDAHSYFTAQVFGYTYEEVEAARQVVDELYALKLNGVSIDTEALTAAQVIVKKRTKCKRTVFGVLYGSSAAGIADTAGIPLSEAKDVVNKMFTMFPSIPGYIRQTENEVRLFGDVYTTIGRKRRFPMSSVRAFQSRCFRQAVNFKIQSTSSEIVLWVLNQIFPIVQHELRGAFHATVHDSLVLSVPDEYVDQVPELMKEYGTRRVAQEFPWLPVEFLWDVDAGRNYGECASIDRFLKGQQQHVIKEDEVITDQEVRNALEQLGDQ